MTSTTHSESEALPADTSSAEEVALAPRLKVVNLTITGRCNLDCPCCYQKRRKDDMDTLVVKRLLDEIAELGTQLLMMPGGEPLLRKDIDEILAHAAGLGLETYLASNATLVTDERARELAAAGLTGVCVGVEVFDPKALEEVDRAGLERTIQGIQCFTRAGLDTFANLIVTRQNLPHLERTVEILAGLGIRRVTLLRPKPAQTGTWFEEARLGPDELYQLQIARARLEATYDLDFVNLDCALGPLQGGLPLELLEEEEIEGCMAGDKYISIDSNGDVYPCAYLKYPELKAGNARMESLLSIFRESEVFTPFRKPALGGACGSCPMKKHCGGCRALAYHDRQDVFAADEDCHWGGAGKLRMLRMGTVFWSWMLVRFARTVTRSRRRVSRARASRLLAGGPSRLWMPLDWIRRKRRAKQRLQLCGAPLGTDREADRGDRRP